MDTKETTEPSQAVYVGDSEETLRETKSSAADARDMARMGKPQEMKVRSQSFSSRRPFELTSTDLSVTLAQSPCSASA